MTRFSHQIGGLLLLLILAGCSGPEPRPTARGIVTYKGQPVAGENITLYWEAPEKQDSFFSPPMPIQEDGTFSGDVSMPGKYKVIIQPSMAAMEKGINTSKVKIPEKYRNVADTDLVWVIEKGVNKRDFELKD